MGAQDIVTDIIDKRGLRWFGHVLRIKVRKWPKRILKCKHPGIRKRDKPRRP